MKGKKVSVSWLFEKDESNAPIKIRIGVTRKRFHRTTKFWKGAIAFLWGLVILYALLFLFRHIA